MNAPRHPVLLPSEAQVQSTIVEGLRMLGYTVLQLGRWRRQTQCPRCGEWHTPRGGYGNEPGTPDLLVGRASWGNRWVALELKRPGGRSLLGTARRGAIRPEQRVLAEAGVVEIVTSWEEALAVVQSVGRGNEAN